jgi:F-type H+-transporting ATPase subunit b
MPQLDSSQYSSQLFWFFLCFAVLYIFASRIILPRIYDIIKTRKIIIDADLAFAKELSDKVNNLNSKTEKLRKEASNKYQTKLQEVANNAASQREKMTEELKEKIEQITANSRHELRNFIAKSRAESEAAIKNLSQKIKEKLFT